MNQQKQTLILGIDGEIFTDPETIPDEQPEKLKLDEYIGSEITLWGRPFADPAGYTKVSLYIDLDLLGGWRYTLRMVWGPSDPKDQSNKTVGNGGYENREDAIKAGIEAYHERVRQIAEFNKHPEPFKWAKFIALFALSCLLVTVAFLALSSLSNRIFPESSNRTDVTLVIGICNGLCCVFSAFVACLSPDHRGKDF